MPARPNAAKLGATLIVVFLLFFIIALWLPQSIVGGPTRELRVRFSQSLPLPTLETGSKVLVAGRPVGRVDGLSLEELPRDAADPSAGSDLYLVVTANIDERIALKRDCRVRAIGEVLGGAGSLVVDVGSDSNPADLSGVLDGEPPGGFGAYLESLGRELDGNNPATLLGRIKTQLDPGSPASLMTKLHRSMDDLNAVTRSVSTQLDPDQKRSMLAKLHETLDHVNATTASLRGELDSQKPDLTLGKLHAALDSINAGLRTAAAILDENRKPIADTAGHIASAAGKLDTRIIESVAEQTDPRNAEGLLAKLNTAMDRLNGTLEDVGVVAGTTREVVTLNRENLNRMLVNFKETSDHLKSAAKYILRHPWRLLNEPDAVKTRQQDIFDAARNFAEAATRLDDASAQLHALARLNDGNIPAEDPDLERIRAHLRQTFEKFHQAENTLWKQLEVR